MVETILVAITSFAGTNLDDLFLNTLFFSEAQTAAERRNIVLGKYLGTGSLIALSVLGAFGLQLLPPRLIGCLGVVPVFLGIRTIMSRNETAVDEKQTAGRILHTAMITMANGADNLGVTMPLFAGMAVRQILLTVCLHLLLIVEWCFLGKALADFPALKKFLAKYQTLAVPVVYIALGVYILLKNVL